MAFGANFSTKLFLTFLSAKTAEELQAQLDQLDMRYTIEGMYFDSANGLHVCWINPMHQVIKKSTLKKFKERK